MLSDLRYALRLLLKAPGFTIAVLCILALGIGANSAIFTLLDRTVIRPLPYANPDRLAMLWEDFSAYGTPKTRVSPATFLDWKRRAQTFEQIGAYGGSAMDLSGGGPPEQVQGQRVTANLLPLLGVPPLLGRTFTADEDGAETKLVVLSYRLWQRRFGGDANLPGKPILMSGEKYTVIGVMPQGFHFPNRETDYWISFGLSPQMLARRGSHFLYAAGRLKPGRTWEQARADLNAVFAQLKKEFPSNYDRLGIKVVSLKDEILGDERETFAILLSAAACVLLIACANVANLLLARSAIRRREVAVRMALGASPMRVVRQILTENLLLACAGGALGLLVARWSMAILQRLVPTGLAASVNLELDSRVVLFAAILAVVTGVLFGLAPALRLVKSEVHMSGRGTVGQQRSRLRNVLVVAEVAIALVLVIGATLLIETIAKMRAVDPGFRSSGILTASIEAPLPKYAEASKWHRFYRDVLDRVRGIPGVRSAGLSSDLPFASHGNTMSLTIEGQAQRPNLGQDALFRLVSPDYLQTIAARLASGRFLSERDNEQSQPVVVINESLARQYWPRESALGHRIDTGTGNGTARWMTVVGVVKDVRERGLNFGVKPAVYVPFAQTEITFFQPSELAALTSREPLSLSKELQRAVWSVDSEQPVSAIRTMDAIVDDDTANRTQVLQLLGAFAGLALVLATAGIYGVLSYMVSQRTREIGLKMAIGANRWDIVRGILGYTGRLTAAGLGVGLIGAIATTRLLKTLLYDVSPLDPAAFGGVAALLAMVAFLAAFVPARRAAAVDPAMALRSDS